ncbi:MAG: WhiB family transcriptional regulator [Acidimicrobiales bacterium]
MSAIRVDELWQLKAACRGPQAVAFFPPQHFERKADKRERERHAKAICASCPVQDACLQYAMEVGEAHGIWGGLNESERIALAVR